MQNLSLHRLTTGEDRYVFLFLCLPWFQQQILLLISKELLAQALSYDKDDWSMSHNGSAPVWSNADQIAEDKSHKELRITGFLS